MEQNMQSSSLATPVGNYYIVGGYESVLTDPAPQAATRPISLRTTSTGVA